jgi:hypothetical protein
MNKRLRLATLGLVAAASTILGLVPATGAQAATTNPASTRANTIKPAASDWDGPYEIVNSGSRACLDVKTEDGINTDGARIQNYHCTGASEQKWYFVDLHNGYYRIVNQRSGKCIDGGHDWLIQWSCGFVPHHEWRRVALSQVNTYQIQERNGGRLIELTSGNGVDGQIYTTDANSNPWWYAQQFELHHV